MRWLRVCDDLWLPDLAQAASRTAAARWLWEAVREGKYTGWDRLVATVRARDEDAAQRLASLSNHEEEDVVASVMGIRLGGAGWCVDGG